MSTAKTPGKAPGKTDTKAQAEGKGFTPTHVRVVALQDEGRHRAGRHWPTEATEVSIDDFTDDQLEQLLNDPKLSVTLVVNDEQAPVDAGKGTDQS